MPYDDDNDNDHEKEWDDRESGGWEEMREYLGVKDEDD